MRSGEVLQVKKEHSSFTIHISSSPNSQLRLTYYIGRSSACKRPHAIVHACKDRTCGRNCPANAIQPKCDVIGGSVGAMQVSPPTTPPGRVLHKHLPWSLSLSCPLSSATGTRTAHFSQSRAGSQSSARSSAEPGGPSTAFVPGQEGASRQQIFDRIAPVYDQVGAAAS